MASFQIIEIKVVLEFFWLRFFFDFDWYSENERGEGLIAKIDLDIASQLLRDSSTETQSHTNTHVLYFLHALFSAELSKWLKQHLLPFFGNPEACVYNLCFQEISPLIYKHPEYNNNTSHQRIVLHSVLNDVECNQNVLIPIRSQAHSL